MRQPVAVIDIGSNSVRLVIYDGVKRHLHVVFNEKVLCGLGRDLATTGLLPPEGKQEARVALRRFVTILRAQRITETFVLATAALRDAKDGAAFITELERDLGIQVTLVSGEAEAHLAAMGVAATMYRPHGLVGDLGGGSLELVEMLEDVTGAGTTLPLGSLRMLSLHQEEKPLRRMIQDYLRAVPWLSLHRYPVFYAVGGSFRSVARVHMKLTGYPLKILHQYAVTMQELRAMAQEFDARNKMKGLRQNRAEAFLPSLMLIEELANLCGFEAVIFSTGGIREGYLYDQLGEAERQKDPLIASVEDILARHPVDPEYAGALGDWMAPLLPEAPQERRLIEAFVKLSETGLTVHQEYRAAWGFDRVLYSSAYGLTHRERVKLALALYHRHRYKLKLQHPALALISEEDKRWAYLLGQAASLAAEITAGSATLLRHFRLAVDGGAITLKVLGSEAITLPDTVAKRLEGLSAAFNAVSSLAK